MVERTIRSTAAGEPKARNTREVVAVRFAAGERWQIERAAGRRKATLSGFIREAALQASAIVEGRVSPVERPPRRDVSAVTMIELEPQPTHFVDGDPVFSAVK